MPWRAARRPRRHALTSLSPKSLTQGPGRSSSTTAAAVGATILNQPAAAFDQACVDLEGAGAGLTGCDLSDANLTADGLVTADLIDATLVGVIRSQATCPS